MTRGWTIERSDPAFPEALEACPDPPARIHGIGDPAALVPGLAVVGSRKATPYGRACADRFARFASGRGIPVVSGAAAGCDITAHRAALDAGGITVAVLGCGPDVDYPATSAQTLRLIRRRGCVIAEVPFGTKPRRWAFPRRNRLIAALSRAVLVVEAALPSGTFSTADHALEAGRDVLAVPGSVFSPGSAGTNRLIRQGASPVTCEEDLADALESAGFALEGPVPAAPTARREADPLLAAVLADPMRPERLAASFGLEVPDVLRRLGELEVAGIAARYPDGTYGPA